MEKLFLRTNYVFGKNGLDYLPTFLLNKKINKVLLVCGKSAIQKMGLLDTILGILNKNNIDCYVYSGIKPNPEDQDVFQASLVAREKKVEAVLAVGGGSVMDSAKMIALIANNPHIDSLRDLAKDYSQVKKESLLVIAVPTTAATASENNGNSVINLTDQEKIEKIPYSFWSNTPELAIENSEYLISNSDWQTGCGIFDIYTHLLDQYLGLETFGWTKEYLFANFRNLLKYAMRFYHNHYDTEARDNIMWTSSMALNAFSAFHGEQDWNIHVIEHEISARWDVSHGAGLALVTPSYLRYISKLDKKYEDKLLVLAKEIYQLDSVEALIKEIEAFIHDLKLPKCWTDFKEIKTKPTLEELESIAHYLASLNRGKELFINLDYNTALNILKMIE